MCVFHMCRARGRRQRWSRTSAGMTSCSCASTESCAIGTCSRPPRWVKRSETDGIWRGTIFSRHWLYSVCPLDHLRSFLVVVQSAYAFILLLTWHFTFPSGRWFAVHWEIVDAPPRVDAVGVGAGVGCWWRLFLVVFRVVHSVSNLFGNSVLVFAFEAISLSLSHTHTPLSSQSTQVQVSDYLESWINYCRLFDALLDCRDTNLVITEGWAFDLIHEFVYQFQSFCQMRGQVCGCVSLCAFDTNT